MDPKVCGKLLTTHRRDNGVNVEALVVDSPSGRVPVKAPRWDLMDTECYGGGNSFSWCSQIFSVYGGIYRRRNSIRGATRGPQGRGRTHPLRARPGPLWPPRLLLDIHSKSRGLRLFQKDLSQRFHSVWTPFDIPFRRNTEIGKKQQFGLGLRLIG